MTDLRSAVERRAFDTLGHANHGWLDARHHFSFGGYHDPARMGWGAIRVWNDDVIAPNSGFPPHPHRDMEIITYVRTGAITHQDSMGNQGRTGAGDVQVMSAGSGVRHAEFNVESEPTTLFQIWIEPTTRGGEPSWGAKPFPKGERSGRLTVLASGFAEDADALPIRAQARVLAATLHAGERLEHSVGEGRHAYLVPATGALLVDGERIDARDGAAIAGGRTVTIEAIDDAEIVLVDAASVSPPACGWGQGRAVRSSSHCPDALPRPLPHAGGEQKEGIAMTKVLVLYYSSYGHIEQMADAVAEGARAGGAEVDIRRVAETAPDDIVQAAHFKTDTAHAVIESPDVLAQYDAIVVGAPTRFGRMPGQMAAFWDTTGGLWAKGALIGKVGGAFTSTASQHGGQETTLFSIITNLLHQGLTIVGLDYGFQGQLGVDEVRGGSPYGATTIAGADGSRQPHEEELAAARYQGKRIAETAAKLFE